MCASVIQAFVEYQQQKMTSDFVEQFGFSEEEFAEQEECIGLVCTASRDAHIWSINLCFLQYVHENNFV